LNSVDLNITKIEYQQHNSTSCLNGSVEFDDEREQATIRFSQPINVKEIYLFLNINFI
jgi:hypothetical protein